MDQRMGLKKVIICSNIFSEGLCQTILALEPRT